MLHRSIGGPLASTSLRSAHAERAPAAHHGPRSEAEWGSKDAISIQQDLASLRSLPRQLLGLLRFRRAHFIFEAVPFYLAALRCSHNRLPHVAMFHGLTVFGEPALRDPVLHPLRRALRRVIRGRVDDE